MATPRKKHSSQTKVKVALEAIKMEKTIAEITSQYGIHGTQINQWKKQVMEIIPEAFSGRKALPREDQQELIDELYRHIGQLTIERDFLKKKLELPIWDEKEFSWLWP